MPEGKSIEKMRSMASIRYCMQTVGAESIGAFANEVDQRLSTAIRPGVQASTATDKRWYAYSKGERILNPDSVSFCILEQTIPEFCSFYENGPGRLWISLLSPPSDLWHSVRGRFAGVDMEMRKNFWSREDRRQFLQSERDLNSVLSGMRGLCSLQTSVLTQPMLFPSLCFEWFSQFVTLYRICAFLRSISNIEIDDHDLYRNTLHFLSVLRAEFERLGIHEDLRRHLAFMEKERLLMDEQHRFRAGLEPDQIDTYLGVIS